MNKIDIKLYTYISPDVSYEVNDELNPLGLTQVNINGKTSTFYLYDESILGKIEHPSLFYRVKKSNPSLFHPNKIKKIYSSYQNISELSIIVFDMICKIIGKNKLKISYKQNGGDCDYCGEGLSKIIEAKWDDIVLFSSKYNYVYEEQSIPFFCNCEFDEFNNFENISIIYFEVLKNLNKVFKNYSFNIYLNDQNNDYYNKSCIKNIKKIENFNKYPSFINLLKLLNNDNIKLDYSGFFVDEFLQRKTNDEECCIGLGKSKSKLVAIDLFRNAIKNQKSLRVFNGKTYVLTADKENNGFVFQLKNLFSEEILLTINNSLLKLSNDNIIEQIQNKIQVLFWEK